MCSARTSIGCGAFALSTGGSVSQKRFALREIYARIRALHNRSRRRKGEYPWANCFRLPLMHTTAPAAKEDAGRI
jgi:DNA-binding response OmpR family regulator